jgi:hypothetical protein
VISLATTGGTPLFPSGPFIKDYDPTLLLNVEFAGNVDGTAPLLVKCTVPSNRTGIV